jgi:hypothetical protein
VPWNTSAGTGSPGRFGHPGPTSPVPGNQLVAGAARLIFRLWTPVLEAFLAFLPDDVVGFGGFCGFGGSGMSVTSGHNVRGPDTNQNG